jgi:hypothetical protein
MKLYEEHLEATPTLGVTEWLDQQGYNVEVLDTRIVPSESSDKCYVVQRIETTKVPFARADVAADSIELVVCSCDSCRYHSFENVDVEQSLGGFSSCKHSRVFREAKAKADDNQVQLL